MRLSQLPVSRKMKIGEDGLPGTNARPLSANRLLDLDDQFCLSPDGICIGGKLRTGGQILLVAEAAAQTRAAFHPNSMSGSNQGGNAGRCQRNTILVCLDLFWNADFHFCLSPLNG